MGLATCRRRAPRFPHPSRRYCRGVSWRSASESPTSSTTAAMPLRWVCSFRFLECTFQHPETSSTHTAHTCRSRFYKQSTHRRCKLCYLRGHRIPPGGHAVTCSLLIRAERADYARIKPPSMHAPSVQPACGLLKVGPRAAASSACTAVQESRGFAASASALPLPTPTASSQLAPATQL